MKVGIAIAVVCIAALVALGAWVLSYFPQPPPPPGPGVLDAVQARFTALRPKLEAIVAAEQENHRRVFVSDSLKTAGDSAKAGEVERRYLARLAQIHEQMRPPLEGQDIVLSDSLIYVSAWARRGHGFSAPWRFVGYVYASRPPEDQAAWPPLVADGRPSRSGVPFRGQYRHLQGRWYLFSLQPW